MRLRAVILDWAGTTVDYGSLAPVRTIQQVFAARGIALAEADARRDMGRPKLDHIRAILELPQVRRAWTQRYGGDPVTDDADRLYAEFIPLQMACLEQYDGVIEGVPHAVAQMRERGLKIGSTTGYTREMLDVLVAAARRQGYSPDCALTPQDAGSGRPYPFMIYEAAIRMQVYPLSAIVKIGDTPVDIEEGRNAGAWSIGVACTGNMIGLPEADWNALDRAERERRLDQARAELLAAGAHDVIDSVADAAPALDAIERRLAAGERP